MVCADDNDCVIIDTEFFERAYQLANVHISIIDSGVVSIEPRGHFFHCIQRHWRARVFCVGPCVIISRWFARAVRSKTRKLFFQHLIVDPIRDWLPKKRVAVFFGDSIGCVWVPKIHMKEPRLAQ